MAGSVAGAAVTGAARPGESAGPSSSGTPWPDRPCWVAAASTASRSTRSFMGSPAWPFTQRKVTSPRSATSSTNGSHRSRLATGLRWELTHPFLIQPSHQRSRKQLTT